MAKQDSALERIIFFSDAVIAIAITLLAINLKIPQSADGHFSMQALRDSAPSFAAFLISFLSIGHFWTIHHRIFNNASGYDPQLMWLNLFWLICITLLPFSTMILSKFWLQKVPVLIYAANNAAAGLLQNLIWLYMTSNKKLLFAGVDHREIIQGIRRGTLSTAVNVLATIVAFVYPLGALIILLSRPLWIILLKAIPRSGFE